ncbi:hypothetical protein GTV32_20515 [Gordonia sp. SID5947]|uniref:ester cyclase n=1 Tax=Gordonia sp. SID5947 TaxID=2690315 RepID=UPI00136A3447|nr:ester cyclase [Gordonia sp. SID5947]MYR08542.1 hypothetical protein [Gordonia sp. SID5947]
MALDDVSQMPVDENTVTRFVTDLVRGFNTHDPDLFTSVMTDDVVFEHSGAPTTLYGRGQVGGYYTTVWTAIPDLTLELADGPFFHPRAPRVSFAWAAAGTHTGPLDPPGLAPTGKDVEFDVREIIEFRGGLASHVRVSTDMAEFARQIGALPARGSVGERAGARMQRLQMKASRRR